jgi:hypothetical protein
VGIYYLVQAGVVVAAEDHTQALFDNRDVGFTVHYGVTVAHDIVDCV